MRAVIILGAFHRKRVHLTMEKAVLKLYYDRQAKCRHLVHHWATGLLIFKAPHHNLPLAYVF